MRKIASIMLCFSVMFFSVECVKVYDVKAAAVYEEYEEGIECEPEEIQIEAFQRRIKEQPFTEKKVITETVSILGGTRVTKNKAASKDEVTYIKEVKCEFVEKDYNNRAVFSTILYAKYHIQMGKRVKCVLGRCYFPVDSIGSASINEYVSKWVSTKAPYHVRAKVKYKGRVSKADMVLYCDTHAITSTYFNYSYSTK